MDKATWKAVFAGDGKTQIWECSKCRVLAFLPEKVERCTLEECPNCGAKMDTRKDIET